MFRREVVEVVEVVLVWIVWKKITFFRTDLVDFEIVIWGLTSLTGFFERVHILLKKATCVKLPKENVFCPNNASETYICNSWRHQNILLVANQLQDSIFLFEINSEGIGTTKFIVRIGVSTPPLKNTTPFLFFTKPPHPP